MSNSLEDYQQRTPGHSPDYLRDHIIKTYSSNWGGKALDLGSGKGGWAKSLEATGKFESIQCVDLVDCREEGAKHFPLELVNLASDNFPFADHSFDHVFAVEVIEHIENPRHFMREIYRVLKPKGKLLMSTPSCDSFRSKLSYLMRGYFPPFCDHDYKGSGHITPISQIDFHRMCKEANFSQVSDDFSVKGAIPSTKIYWQSVMPWLNGRNWSDCYISVVSK